MTNEESWRLLQIASHWFEIGNRAFEKKDIRTWQVARLAHQMTHAAHSGKLVGEAVE